MLEESVIVGYVTTLESCYTCITSCICIVHCTRDAFQGKYVKCAVYGAVRPVDDVDTSTAAVEAVTPEMP